MAKSHTLKCQLSLELISSATFGLSFLSPIESNINGTHVEKIVTRKTYFSRHLCSLLRGPSCGEAKNDRNDPKKETLPSPIRSDSILTDWLILLESNRRKGTPTSEGRKGVVIGRKKCCLVVSARMGNKTEFTADSRQAGYAHNHNFSVGGQWDIHMNHVALFALKA